MNQMCSSDGIISLVRAACYVDQTTLADSLLCIIIL